jgi:mono/diheme cytochrome c family protein
MKQTKSNPKPGSGPDIHKPQRSKFDDAEPSAANVPMPVWVFVVLPVLLFWGMVFLDKNAGGFNPQVYGPATGTNQVAIWNKGADDPISRGSKVYATTCIVCHQPTGMGSPGQFPPLVGSEWVLAPEPDRVIRIALDGLTGPVTVKGQPWNATMVPWRGVLNDRQVADVVSFVRNQWGNKASMPKPDRVKKIRDDTASRGGAPWTAPELEKVPVGQ